MRSPESHRLGFPRGAEAPLLHRINGRLRETAGVQGEPNPQDRRAIYDELGVALRYEPQTREVHVAAGAPHVLRVGVGGVTQTPSTWHPWHGRFLAA